MFNLGFSELLILGVIILVFIGPKELPEVARVIARMLNELKRTTSDLRETLLEPKRQIDEVLNQQLDPNHKGDVVPDVPAEPEKPKKDSSS